MNALLARVRGLGKALLKGLLRLLPRRGADGPLDASRIESILVIRTDDRVGNLLLTTPLLAAIREALPKVRLGLLCAARRAPLVEGTGLYDELWPFEKRDFFWRPHRFVRFCWRLRRARYQVAIDAGHWHAFSFTSGMLALWSGAGVRIGHRRGEADRVLTHAVQKDPEQRYDAGSKLELLAPLGITQVEAPPMQTALGRAEAGRFAELFADRPALIVNPGGRKSDHRWPPHLFARAAAGLRDRCGLAIWVAFGPGEEALGRGVVAQAPGARLLPATNLAELAGVLRACALFLTNDTGPMHLAAAVGAPTVALFLTEDRQRWAAPVPCFVGVPVAGLAEEPAIHAVIEAGAKLSRARS
jgi:heptosyltransferase-3